MLTISSLSENNEQWNNFILQNQGSFTQSWEWGSFQETLGKKVWRLKIKDDSQTVLQAQIIKETFALGKSLLYLPLGPVLSGGLTDDRVKESLKILYLKARGIAKTENAIFLLVEPAHELPIISGLNIAKPLKRVQPQQTLILDLNPPAEEIFRNLGHKTTRYNIRFATNKGMIFKEAPASADNINIFYQLLQKTTQRDKFITYSQNYFTALFKQMPGNNAKTVAPQVKLFFAQYQGEIIAANIVLFWGQQAIYLFAASDYQKRNLMAPYFLQWNQILAAKNIGCTEYDFWGIDEKKWPGVTYFKKSFGGQEKTYPTGQAMIFQKGWYRLYGLMRKLKR